MTIDYKALGAKIKEYRKKENITQEQLAEMADISLSHMSNIETASASVSLPALKLIADALDVTLDELLIDSYSKKQKEYLYSRKLECILEQCETVEQDIMDQRFQSIDSIFFHITVIIKYRNLCSKIFRHRPDLFYNRRIPHIDR